MKKEKAQTEYTPTQTLFLERLEHLLLIRKLLPGTSQVSRQNKWVSMAIHSTLLDCRDLRIEDEARRIMGSYAQYSQRKGG